MALLQQCGNGVKRQRTLVCKNCEEHINISNPQRERPHKRDGVPRKERGKWTEREKRMQCFMETEDKSPTDVENVETTYFDNCFLCCIGPIFAAVLSHSSQSCFSRILCNLLHPPLWCVHCFIVLALSISTSLRLLCALMLGRFPPTKILATPVAILCGQVVGTFNSEGKWNKRWV